MNWRTEWQASKSGFYRVRNLTKEISYACYEGALFDIKFDLEAEIEIESKRIENASNLKLKNEQPDEKVETLRTSLQEGSNGFIYSKTKFDPDLRKTDHVAKAAFIAKLTPYRARPKSAQKNTAICDAMTAFNWSNVM
ncbi:MAG: hypothetical protein IPJ55_13875 [Chloracidobacterium sp.]|nr:hypothetical protein [Chloracidobacterium sp.]